MSTRALSRSGQPAAPLIDLPTAFRPQVVNSEGYELSQEDIASSQQAFRGTDEFEGTPDVSSKDDTKADVDENDLDDAEEPQTEKSLLSLADTLVLPYSLTLARQHHLTHLLPHIFSHPIVPVHSRPRTRGPPKSTFLFPTLLPPTHPLPNKEYHDTTKTASSSTPPEPPKKTSKSLSADKEEPPAHQTECIARITLSIGPISYPGTELWVGQFVEPRMAPPIKDKINKVVRQLPHDTAAGRRAALSNTPRASPIPRESTAPRSSLLPSPRGHLPPTLIQRVNVAATQHPWLSVIIHKAAHSNASKEELAKLGRVVERIKRGEPISEGGNPRSSINAAGSATSAAAQAGPSRPILAAPSIVVVEDSSDSDADVDMTGAKQVGGGTIPTQQQSTPRTPAQSVTSMQGRPTPEQVIHPVLSLSSASPVLPRAPHPGQLSSKTSGGVTPVPPPRPIHPPPFLLVAFKEAPTEKYLLPLGLQSFVSRIGGDYVTGPPPAERKVEKPPLAASQSMPNTVAPSILSDDMRVPVVPLSKSGVGRTRAALRGTKPETTASAPELANAANDETVLEGTVNVSNRKLDLLPLPSMDPPAGTVLFSTMVPARNWVRPVWAELAKRLPFVKPGFGGSQAEVGTDHSESTLSSGKDAAQSSPGDFLHQEAPAPGVDSSKHRQSTLLNLAATSFIPTEGDVHPVTIRLGEIDDRAWRRIKHVLDEVERTEMVTLGVTRSASIRAESATPIEVPSDPNNSDLSKSAALQTAPVPLFSAPFKPGFHPRSIYTQRKRSYFKNLLLRNPRRRFLRQRLPSPLLSLIEATSDRWAARPYPISTKALYTTDGGYAVPTLPVPNSPEPLKKKRRVEGEPEVTFELPVSLDALDERVAEGAMRGLTKRGRGRGGRTDSTKRKYAERAPLDRACEGCGRVGRKLWRPGPGGKRTLCNLCGDKYLAGTLGDLKNPSATTLGAEVGDKSQQESGIVSDGGPEQAVGTSLPETSDTALQLGSREDAEMTTNPIADQPNIGLFKEQGIASQPIGASIAAGRGTSEPFHGIDETSFPRPDSQDTTKEVALRSGTLTELKADS